MLKKITSFIVFTTILATLNACSTRSMTEKSAAPAIVNWNSEEGIKRLEESQHKIDFFKLANHFESQNNKLFCGPATAAIVLNALRVRRSDVSLPRDNSLLSQSDLKFIGAKKKWNPLFQRYTQNNIFINSPKSRAVVLGVPLQREKVKDRGFQLQQLAGIFSKHDLSVSATVVQELLKEEAQKAEIIKNLSTPNDYVIINYKRAILQQAGGGHISPLGAYHKASDSFLIMDVTPNKADWVWVKAAVLFSAMRTFDTVENRGYLLVGGL